jgi:hypothetical protein
VPVFSIEGGTNILKFDLDVHFLVSVRAWKRVDEVFIAFGVMSHILPSAAAAAAFPYHP